MKHTTNISEDTYIIAIEGDLDAGSSVEVDAILEKAIAAGKPNLLIDCHSLTYISSTGLGVFISYLRRLEDRKIKLVLYGMSDKIKNVFAILGLHTLIPFTENLQEAMAICQVNQSVSC